MLWKSLMLLVCLEHERYGWKKNLNTVMWLLNKAKINDDDTPSELDEQFKKVVEDTKGQERGGYEHPAVVSYNKVMVGAADTKRSIVISANSRLSRLETPDVQRILEDDELDLASMGTGITEDGRKGVKTALFCIIPDSDKTYNLIAGMMYTLLFQELLYQADFRYGGKLPVPVTFWLDEFANISLPSEFIKQTDFEIGANSKLVGKLASDENLIFVG